MIGKQIREIACGHEHSLAVSQKSLCYGWGSNKHGQLGLQEDLRYVNSQFSADSVVDLDYQQIFINRLAAGGEHSIFLDRDKNVMLACGLNSEG